MKSSLMMTEVEPWWPIALSKTKWLLRAMPGQNPWWALMLFEEEQCYWEEYYSVVLPCRLWKSSVWWGFVVHQMDHPVTSWKVIKHTNNPPAWWFLSSFTIIAVSTPLWELLGALSTLAGSQGKQEILFHRCCMFSFVSFPILHTALIWNRLRLMTKKRISKYDATADELTISFSSTTIKFTTLNGFWRLLMKMWLWQQQVSA